jgi:hypothetical protein
MPSLRRSGSQPRTDSSTPTASPPERHRVLRAELRCYLCAATCGALEAPPSAGMPPVAHFFPADGSPGRLLVWRRLRCPRCASGSLFLDEPETLVRRVERIDWDLDRPRRGRPPRWLVALRAQHHAA